LCRYVEEFIGCFFIPENQLLDWVQVHPEYAPKHVLAVMGLMTVKYDMKRSKKKEFIEEVEKILRGNGHAVEEHSSLSLFGADPPLLPPISPRIDARNQAFKIPREIRTILSGQGLCLHCIGGRHTAMLLHPHYNLQCPNHAH